MSTKSLPLFELYLQNVRNKQPRRIPTRSWQSTPHPLCPCAFQPSTSTPSYAARSLQQQRRAAISLNAPNEGPRRTQGYVGYSRRAELLKWWNSRKVGDV